VAEIFSLLNRVNTDSETHSAPYPMGARGSFPGVGKAVGAWSWPLTSSSSSHTFSWPGAYLSVGYVFMVWCLAKHKIRFHGQLIFAFTWHLFESKRGGHFGSSYERKSHLH